MKTNFKKVYWEQLQLLLRVILYIAEETCFCLKGGTAINLFIRDVPRISVDIDLVYSPINDRNEALAGIERGLFAIKNRLLNAFRGIDVVEKRTVKDHRLNKLFVRDDNIQITIEPNTVLRGTLYPVEVRRLSEYASQQLQMAVSNVPTLNFAMYDGWIHRNGN